MNDNDSTPPGYKLVKIEGHPAHDAPHLGSSEWTKASGEDIIADLLALAEMIRNDRALFDLTDYECAGEPFPCEPIAGLLEEYERLEKPPEKINTAPPWKGTNRKRGKRNA